MNYGGPLQQLRMKMQSFELGTFLAGQEDLLEQECEKEVIPLALKILSANNQAHEVKTQIHDAMCNFFVTHANLLSLRNIQVYYQGVSTLVGEEAGKLSMYDCLAARQKTEEITAFLNEDPKTAELIFLHLVRKGQDLHGDNLKRLLGFMRPLDPASLTIADLKKIRDAKICEFKPDFFTVPLFRAALDTCNGAMLELCEAEELPAEELANFFILGVPSQDERIKKMQDFLLGNSKCMGRIIGFMIRSIQKNHENGHKEPIELLRQLIKTSPRMDPSSMAVEEVLYLHRTGYFMTMPGLFSADPLHAAFAKADFPRICAFLAEEGSNESLRSVKPEQASPVFESLLSKALVAEEPWMGPLARELASLDSCIDLTRFHGRLFELFQLLVRYRIPLNKKGLFSQDPLTQVCTTQNQLDVFALLILHQCSWDGVPKNVRQQTCWHFLHLQCGDMPSKNVVSLVLKSLFQTDLHFDPNTFADGHFIIMNLLGLSVNPKGVFGKSPLVAAFEKKDKKRILFLLSSGANINDLWSNEGVYNDSVVKYFKRFLTITSKTPAGLECRRITEKLISLGARVITNGEFEDSLLMSALKDPYKTPEYQDFVEYLFSLGFHLEATNRAGQTLFTWGLSKGPAYWNLVQNCLKLKAEVNVVDNDGHGPMYHAIKGGINPQSLRTLLATNVYDWFVPCDGVSVVHIAWQGLDYSLVYELIEKGCNPNITHPATGETLLMDAIRRGDERLIKLIFAQKPDLSIKDKRGRTAFAIAFDCDRLDLMLEILNRGGASFEFKKIDRPINGGAEAPRLVTDGESLLTWSAMVKEAGLPFIEKLLASGASINMVNNAGETLLHYAIRKRNNALVDFCFAKNADVNIKNVQGDSPLMYSLMLGEDAISVQLLEKGAALYDMNEYGLYPIDWIGSVRFMVINEKGSKGEEVEKKVLVYCPRQLKPEEVGMSRNPLAYSKLLDKLEHRNLIEKIPSEILCKRLYEALDDSTHPIADQTLLECALIFNYCGVSRRLAKKIGPERFASIFAALIKKYEAVMPQKYWLNHLLDVSPEHIKIQVCGAIAEAPANGKDGQPADINQLLLFYDAINVTDPSRSDYFDPKENGNFHKRRLELRRHLAELIADTITKKSRRKFNNPEEDFKTLHRLLSQMTVHCQNLEPRQRSLFIIDLAKEAENCSVGWVLSVNNLNTLLNLQLGKEVRCENLETKLYHQLMLIRSGKLELLSGAGVHTRNRWLQAIGKKINVPEANNLGSFGDAYGYSPLNSTECMLKFLHAYHPFLLCSLASKVISETLKEERQQSEKSAVIGWFETHIPEGFRKPFYDMLKKEIDAGQHSWQAVFDKHAIAYNPAWKSADIALEKAKQQDYVYNHVFPQGREIPELAAVVHVLVDLKVLSEKVPGIVEAVTKELKALKRMEGKKRKTQETVPAKDFKRHEHDKTKEHR